MTIRPCRRPKVTVDVNGDRVSAVCLVPGCDWTYANSVKCDVTENARHHRARHKANIPATTISMGDGPRKVRCSCGWERQDSTTTTRSDAEQLLAHHLSTEHGLVTC